MQINLADIIKWTKADIIGLADKVVDSFLIDSRIHPATEQSMFICIVGERHNGHRYIRDMYQKGVRLFLVSEKPETNTMQESAFLLVEDTLAAFQQIARGYREQFELPVVAITGSNAKTIIKEWLAHCLLPQVNLVRNPKSYNSQVGVPLSVLLLDKLHNMGVFEAGISQIGEMESLRDIIQPSFGIFTNIGQAHQEGFKSIEEKVKEKLQLFSKTSTIYYCADHKLINSLVQADKNLKNIEKITWSLKEPSVPYYYKTTVKEPGYTSVELVVQQKDSIKFRLPFTDDANIENALHVTTFLLHRGFGHQLVKERIENLPKIAMRMEQVTGKNNSVIINDSYNSDFNALQKAIENLITIHKESLVLIISDIDQSGQTGTSLYQQVAGLVKKSGVTKIIGIGETISASANLFEGIAAEFYPSTEKFLDKFEAGDFVDSAILVKGARRFKLEQVVARLEQKMHETLLEINLEYLVSNLNYFRSLLQPRTKIMVMAKALTYGSGGKEIARLLQHQKVDYLGVAFADEGVELRNDGIHLPIMVLSPVKSNFRQIIEYNLEPEIYSLEILKEFSREVASMQLTNYPVHIKIDTGMHRLGFTEDTIDELIHLLSSQKHLHIKSVMSHLAVSDNPNEDAFTHMQIERLTKAAEKLEKALGYVPMRQILNSAGIERFPKAHFDMVRLGIGLHGISSTGAALKATSRLRTVISQVKEIPLGETIGYNRHGVAGEKCKIAIIPIGYADGLNRRFGNGTGSVVIKGQGFPFVGDICMDMSMIDITGANDIHEGDEVVIFGPEKSIKKLAAEIGTIPYEILTSISQRVKRVYIHE